MCVCAFAWLSSSVVMAQVDPEESPEPDGTLVAPPTQKKAPAVLKKEPPPVEKKIVFPVPTKEGARVLVKQTSDAELNAAWANWRDANRSKNTQAEQAARKALVEVRTAIASTNSELWAVGLLRAARVWEESGDTGAALEIAGTAVELAPQLPATWFLLGRLQFVADPTGLDRCVSSLWRGVKAQMNDPRYFRPMFADAFSVLMAAFVITSMVVVGVLLLRRGFYFLYDFHFFFPRVVARWQTAALGVLLLSLPIVFHFSVAGTLLTFFAAVTMYLSRVERLLVVALIAFLGAVPWLSELVVEHAAFAQTAAEDVYLIERGGPGAEAVVEKYERLASEDKIGFAERYALGHFYLNRGSLDEAKSHLKGALAIRPEDAPARIALAKVLFLEGDLENSRAILEAVKQASPSATVFFDLSQLYRRRVQVFGEASAGEIDKANSNMFEARQLDPSLPNVVLDALGPEDIVDNTFLKTLPLAQSDLLRLARGEEAARQVRSQLSLLLLGNLPLPIAPFFPLAMALVLLGFGSIAKVLGASRACNRCGRPVSRWGDPEVLSTSVMCTQCVNVFAKSNVVGPSVRVRKQLEITRFERQLARASTFFGVLWAGMGDVFSGAPLRGTVYGYFFILAVIGMLSGEGVVRPSFEGLPLVLRAVPLGVLFLAVYSLSLVGLRRKVAS